MKSYVINLDRRPDRLAAMEAEARNLGLCLTRIAAVDGQAAESAALADRWFAAGGPLGPLSRYEKCCSLSHRAAWTALAESGDSHAVILEDDVRLAPAAAALLADAGWVPPDAGLIKLEHFGPRRQMVLVTEERALPGGLTLARLASRHTGAGAYLISRRAAERLLAVPRFDLPVDHLLFNPNNSPLFAALRPWQMLPPVARQRDFVGAHSDLEPARRPLRRASLAYVKRELVRAAHDAKLVPWQAFLLLSGKARLVDVGQGVAIGGDALALPAQ